MPTNSDSQGAGSAANAVSKRASTPLGPAPSGVYGDTALRNYTDKLALFNRFVEPELRAAIAALGIRLGQKILDVGCGVGQITQWLGELAAPNGFAVGMDLAQAHVRDALCRASSIGCGYFVQAHSAQIPFARGAFDWVWASNSINHIRDAHQWLRDVMHWIKPGGHLVVGQSSFLPDMVFAWDARLERAVTYACRKYYCHKYGLDEDQLSAPRDWVGKLRAAGFVGVRAKTITIERTAPLSEFDRFYFVEWFKNYWGHRVKDYLSAADWRAVQALTSPDSPRFAPDRPDFHHIETYTLITGQVTHDP